MVEIGGVQPTAVVEREPCRAGRSVNTKLERLKADPRLASLIISRRLDVHAHLVALPDSTLHSETVDR